MHTYKDQVLLEKNEVLTQQGSLTACLPRTNAPGCKSSMRFNCKPYPVQRYAQHLAPRPPSTRHAPAHAG